jgi:predicted aspartyl protease
LDSQSFTLTSHALLRTLITPAKVCEAFDPSNASLNQTIKRQIFDAIWDTGATGTVITQKIIDACGLKPVGMTMVSGIHGDKPSEIFIVNVELPNAVGFHSVQVTKGEIRGADMLIGMDIISTGDFAVTNKNGQTIFSFRCPSMEHIDFVKPNPFTVRQKQGRNDPCSCGSGKKYKHCCGKGL